ncbi:putative pentatricopeptide repeat-containing protein At5g06400, mitochondrial [Andrographis paniculata]|uniref:putative pentatricopeptide repeat-containing protein At5g06400, mitochondrial n=1 Tax=Andrographis paniculata TaxID=175694 RepID=UPI0021E85AC3|nr:putative pentatricopeptide repeat-containing protein At5g06400, mitochondrial [Andrographis paniculata]
MKHLFKGGFLKSNPCNDIPNWRSFSPGKFQLVGSSVVSSRSVQTSRRADENSDLTNSRESKGFGPLLDEILGILGTDAIEVDTNASDRLSEFKERQLRRDAGRGESSSFQGQSVCRNAEEKTDDIKMGGAPGEGILDEIEVEDVSPVVHKVTEIVRSENAVVSMEDRFATCDFNCNEEVVEKVLKRCFKVPHLALKFFNWVKHSKGFNHTTNTFNVMISIAGEEKDISLVENLAEEMKKSSCERDAKTWTILLSHYGKANHIGKALLVFEEMKRAGVEPDSTAYRTMLRALCNARKPDLALEFYKDMVLKEVKLDAGLYKQLLKCVASGNAAAGVHLVGENMVRLSEIPEPQIYGLMLQSFCIAGRIKESLELIQDMKNKNVVLDAGIFETLVKGLCTKDRITDAMEILEIMKRRNEFNPNIYGILISAYLRRNEVTEAFNLFAAAKKLGNVPISTYTNLMQHFFWNKEFQKGVELYNEVLEKGIQLDSVAITAVAIAYVQQNRLSEASKVFKSMYEKGFKPTRKSYIIFIKELCKASKAEEIDKVLSDLICELDIRDDVLRQVLSYLERKGDLEKMNVILGIQRGFTSHPRGKEELNSVRANQVELVGEPEQNRSSQERRLDHFPESGAGINIDTSVQQVCQILSSLSDWSIIQERLGKLKIQFTPELVVGILQNSGPNIGTALKFFSWVGKQSGYCHAEKSYHAAIKIAGQGKNFKEMRCLFHEMKKRGCLITSDTWTIMIQQYGRIGLTDIALKSFKEMKLSGCKPSKSTYKSLITSLCGKKGRKARDAIQLYHEMVRSGFVPGKELIETYICCLCEVNELSEARTCIESLYKFGFSVPLSYSLYFRALSRAGRLEDALALMDEIGSEKNILDQYTYGSLIHGLLRRGQLEEALAKIKSMKQVGINPTVHVYTSLIIYFLKAKEIDRAHQTLEEMKKHDCEPSIVTYSALICGYVRLGRVSDAWSLFHHLKQNGPAPDFKTYSMFIHCLSRVGNSEEAFKLISEMLNNGIIPSTINFRKVIYGLNSEGKRNLARIVLKKKLDLERSRKLFPS